MSGDFSSVLTVRTSHVQPQETWRSFANFGSNQQDKVQE